MQIIKTNVKFYRNKEFTYFLNQTSYHKDCEQLLLTIDIFEILMVLQNNLLL